HRNVGHARSAEEAPVALDFRGWAERFRVVVGELYRRAAFDTGYFADQADGIKAAIAPGIAAAEIIGQQRAPARAETNATARGPLARIVEVVGASEIPGGGSVCQRSTEVGVQPEDF